MGLSAFFRFDSFDAERSVTSFFVQPSILIITRVLGLIYLVAVLAGALATTSSLKYFIQFFTNIGWVALTLYYLWALILSVQYCRLSEFERTQWGKKGSRALQILFWIVYSSQAVYHMLIPLIFWTLMRKYQRPHTGVYEWATVSEHTTNVVFMALEMTLTRITMDVRHIVFTLGFVLLYLLMAFVDHWINGTWVYSALDYEKMGWTKVGLFYAIVAVGMTVVYLALWKLHQIKERRGVLRLQRRLQAQLEIDIESVASTQEPKKRKSADRRQEEKENSDPRQQAIEEKKDIKQFRAARLPVVLCHGFSGFDSLGQNPDFRFDYWYGVRDALDNIGCKVHTARVPPFAGVQERAERLKEYIERSMPHGAEVNLIGHSMGGLDCRYMISHLKSNHFKVKSLTTLGTPHHGSSFADYVMSDIVGQSKLEVFWTIMSLVGIERGAAENLTTYYLKNEFNPHTPNDPNVAYFSYAAAFEPGFFSRFRFPWRIIMDREGPNDGLVSVESAKWGTFIRTIPNADHMDLMNWVNALAWSRAQFPWILGGSSHDPEGRPKGAFEMDNDEASDRDAPQEEPTLFNAIELYLKISDMLHKKGL